MHRFNYGTNEVIKRDQKKVEIYMISYLVNTFI